MTEYEINLAVAKKLGHQPSLECGVVKIEDELCHGKIVTSSDFDPCNNAQQAWEIMIDNNISVTKDGDWYFAMNELHYTYEGAWVPSSHAVDRKPFVAAMLLFLEI